MNEVSKNSEKNLTISERFTAKVFTEASAVSAKTETWTEYQKSLVNGYFVAIDKALKKAEEDRVRKNENNKDHRFDNDLEVSWSNIQLDSLALDVAHYAKIGLDMSQENHLFPIPFKNNKTKKYDIELMKGYNAYRLMAEKYAADEFVSVTVELVYDTDVFKPIKRSHSNPIETYEFEIKNVFDRGGIIGGFGYIEYEDPKKNKLITMSIEDILKRKPKHASATFWGGKSFEWKGKEKVEVAIEGWFPEMCLKVLKREVYKPKNIPLDPQKIDDHYRHLLRRELEYAESEVARSVVEADVIEIDGQESFLSKKDDKEEPTSPPVESKNDIAETAERGSVDPKGENIVEEVDF